MESGLTWLIAGMGAFSLGLLGWAVVSSHDRFLKSGEAGSRFGRLPLFFRITMPYIMAYSKMLGRYRKFTPPSGFERKASHTQTTVKGRNLLASTLDWLYLRSHKRLMAAGSPLEMDAQTYLGFWLFGIVAGTITGAGLSLLTGWWALVAIFFLLGVLLPLMWLSDMVTKRQVRIKKELPYALDLLTLSVEAGLDFTAAMAGIVERLEGSPLSHEFDLVHKEINMGRQRADALRDMGNRTDLFEVNNVVSSLIQADELGTGLGRVLRIQAEDVRRRRFELAEKKAQQAPVKMLFPLVVFIFPATMITIGSPILVKLIQAAFAAYGG